MLRLIDLCFMVLLKVYNRAFSGGQDCEYSRFFPAGLIYNPRRRVCEADTLGRPDHVDYLDPAHNNTFAPVRQFGQINPITALSVLPIIFSRIQQRRTFAGKIELDDCTGIKKAIKIMTVTKQYHQEDLEKMKKFYKNNATEVAKLVKDGEDAVPNDPSALPRLGRMMLFHDQETKQELTGCLKRMREIHLVMPACET